MNDNYRTYMNAIELARSDSEIDKIQLLLTGRCNYCCMDLKYHTEVRCAVVRNALLKKNAHGWKFNPSELYRWFCEVEYLNKKDTC